MGRVLILVVIIALFASPSGYAKENELISGDSTGQIPSYSIEYLDNRNGLLQNEITGLYLSPQQFLWIATHQGLVRYSGRSLKVFSPETDPAISSGRIKGIYRDDEGAIMVRQGNHDVAYINEDQLSIRGFDRYSDPYYFFFEFGSCVKTRSMTKLGFHQFVIDSNRAYVDLGTGMGRFYFLDHGHPQVIPYPLSEYSQNNLFLLDEYLFLLDPKGYLIRIHEQEVDTLGRDDLFAQSDDWHYLTNNGYTIWSAINDYAHYFKDGRLYRFSLRGEDECDIQIVARDVPKQRYTACVESPANARIFLGTKDRGLLILKPKLVNQVNNSATCAAG